MKNFIKIILVSLMILSTTSCFAENKHLGTEVLNSIDTVYHDAKDIVTTIYNDGKDAARYLYPDIKNALNEIGKAIGIAAEHVYVVLVKKYIVTGVKWCLIFIGSLILLILGICPLYKLLKQSKPITYSIIAPVLLVIVGLIVLLNINYDEMLMGLVNPEYGAINYILEYSKQLIK